MKICTTCGASVADDAEVCPDCGMELNSGGALPASAPAAAPAAPSWPAPAETPASDLPPVPSSGFTMDFGAGGMAAPVTPPFPAEQFFPAEPAASIGLEPPMPALTPVPAAPPAFATAQLTLKRGGLATAEVFTFGGSAVVGRFDTDSGPVDVDLGPLPEATYVSRHHAEFRFDGSSWFIRDMGSRNGTFWRSGGQGAFSRVVEEQPLASGDEVALGNARFEFKTI